MSKKHSARYAARMAARTAANAAVVHEKRIAAGNAAIQEWTARFKTELLALMGELGLHPYARDEDYDRYNRLLKGRVVCGAVIGWVTVWDNIEICFPTVPASGNRVVPLHESIHLYREDVTGEKRRPVQYSVYDLDKSDAHENCSGWSD